MRLAQTEATAPATLEGDEAAQPDGDWLEIEEEVFEQMPVRDARAANTSFNINAEGIDDDIREIFLEEMQEEIDNLRCCRKGLAGRSRPDSVTDQHPPLVPHA